MTGKRVATAAVLIPLVVGIVLWGSTKVLAVAVAVLTLLALHEYYALGEAIGHRAYRKWTSLCAVLLICVQCLESYSKLGIVVTVRVGGVEIPETPSLTGVLFLFVIGMTMITLWTRRPLVESLPAAGISASAFLLVAFPLSFAVPLHALPLAGRKLLLFACVITWAGDSVAYFVGRAMGKHPLAPHISPKKTWEGSVGGMIGSLVAAVAFWKWMGMPLPYLLGMAVVGNVAGQMGDLLESACKRSAGVKDSGGMLPGHGGILDRIDALILCIPAVWYYLMVVNPPIL